MSCKCFFGKPTITSKMSFEERLKASACQCKARFTVEENHRRFSISSKNLNDVNKYKIDKWLINDSIQKKCDYFFEYKKNSTIRRISIDTCIFVELKGVDINHAIEQIDETIKVFKKNGYFSYVTVYHVVAAVVFSHYPSNDSSFRLAVTRLKKNHKDLKVEVIQQATSLIYNP